MASSSARMDRDNVVFQAISGNVIGIVERPDVVDPGKPIAEQYQVKFGVIDPNDDLPKSDAQVVIARLQEFCKEFIT